MFIRSSIQPPPRAQRAPRDALAEVLHDLRLEGVAFGRCDLRGRWGLEFAPDGYARFHFVAQGSAFIEVEPGRWTELSAGDVVLLPRGEGHAMADRPRRRTRPIEAVERVPVSERTFHVREGKGARETLLLCGSVELGAPALQLLVKSMPTVLRLKGGAGVDPTLPALLSAMAEEVRVPRIGGTTMLERLAELVLARLLRAWLEQQSELGAGFMAALRDGQLGRALAALHARPGADWSVTRLAREARMSRSAFAQRFVETLGVSPARYVARTRMLLARRWLLHDAVRVGEAAARLGYDSEPSFSRAFKRALGVAPSTLRREAATVAPRVGLTPAGWTFGGGTGSPGRSGP